MGRKKSNNKQWVTVVMLLCAVAAGAIQWQKGSNEVAQEESAMEQSASVQNSTVAANTPVADIEIPAALTDRPEQIVRHEGFTLSYNNKHNTPNWSAWALTAEHTDGPVNRSSKFWADPEIPRVYRVDYYDYKESGYDRGHMCPAGDMKWSEQAMHDCFYMSNMCPQTHSLNAGSWGSLESACRVWARTEGVLYIVCGPVYKGKRHERIGIDHVIDVPEGFFKAVLSLRKGHEKAIAFYYDNDETNPHYRDACMSVDDIEAMTGMDLFPNVSDAIEKKVEASYNIKEWKK